MTDRLLLVSASALKAFIMSVFDRWGTPPAIADLTADLMVRTDLRGVDSHGVGMLPTYQRWHARGWIVPAAEPKVERDEGTTAVVDILSGVLAGAAFADVRRRNPDPSRPDIGHFFGAIDIARFRDLDAFKADMDDLLQALKASPKAEGQDRIYVAGEPEWECEQHRRREGIPLAPGLVSQLRDVSAKAGVPFTLGA